MAYIRDDRADAATDRRVRRTRRTLMLAAIDEVRDRGTSTVTLTNVCERADVSRQVLYRHFSGRDDLLLQAGLALARGWLDKNGGAASPLGTTAHLLESDIGFWRPALTGQYGGSLHAALIDLMRPINQERVTLALGDSPAGKAAPQVSAFITGGIAQILLEWLRNPSRPSADDLIHDFERIVPLLTEAAPNAINYITEGFGSPHS